MTPPVSAKPAPDEGVVERVMCEMCDEPSACPAEQCAFRLTASGLIEENARLREAASPFVDRLVTLESNCRKLDCGVPGETNVRTKWLRNLRAALSSGPDRCAESPDDELRRIAAEFGSGDVAGGER